MKYKIDTKVENDEITEEEKLQALDYAIKQFNGKEITISIERKKKKRSEQQNKYYWGVIIKLIQNAIKEQWGEIHEAQEVHELLKINLFYSEIYNNETGEVLKIGKSTAQATTIEFEEYQEDCRKWALEWFGINIPLPNDDIEIEN